MRVAPTFLVPTVTDSTVENSWNINGDTPAKVRIYTKPSYGSPVDVQPIQNSYKWTGLGSGTLYAFNVICVYPDGEEKGASFTASTTPQPPVQEPPSINVTDLRARQNGFHVRLDFLVPPGAIVIDVTRAEFGKPATLKHVGKFYTVLNNPAVAEPRSFTDKSPLMDVESIYCVNSLNADNKQLSGGPCVQIVAADPRFSSVQEAITREKSGPHRRAGGG